MNKRQRKQAKKLRERQRRETQVPETTPTGSQQSQGIATNLKAKSTPTPAGRPHLFTIIVSGIVMLTGLITLYWNLAQPDLRYVPRSDPELMTVLETKFDSSGNLIHNLRARPTFTNYSFKPGFIDKAEFVPQTIATLPDIKVTGINKTRIFWHQEKQVEITFLMAVPTDVANNPNSTRELAMEEVLSVFDNTGKKVDHLQNGLFGRIHFDLKDVVNTRPTPDPGK